VDLVEIAFEDDDGWAPAGPPITLSEWMACDPDGASEALSEGLIAKGVVYLGGGAAPRARVRIVSESPQEEARAYGPC
jgi:hypothetical protein